MLISYTDYLEHVKSGEMTALEAFEKHGEILPRKSKKPNNGPNLSTDFQRKTPKPNFQICINKRTRTNFRAGGSDTLYGGLGNDTLNGGAGNDTYL